MSVYKETLQEVPFVNYKSFDNRDIIFSVFIFRFQYVINAIAPFKTVRIKNNPCKSFGEKTAETMHTRDCTKDYNYSDCMLIKKSIKKCVTQLKIQFGKKTPAYFEERIKKNTTNPKKLWKTCKPLGLPRRRPFSSSICLKSKEG